MYREIVAFWELLRTLCESKSGVSTNFNTDNRVRYLVHSLMCSIRNVEPNNICTMFQNIAMYDQCFGSLWYVVCLGTLCAPPTLSRWAVCRISTHFHFELFIVEGAMELLFFWDSSDVIGHYSNNNWRKWYRIQLQTWNLQNVLAVYDRAWIVSRNLACYICILYKIELESKLGFSFQILDDELTFSQQ